MVDVQQKNKIEAVRNNEPEPEERTGLSSGVVTYSIAIPSEMKEWLANQKNLNKSKIYVDAVNMIRYPQKKKVSSQIVLMMFMNFIISMGMIFVSLWMPIQVAGENTQYLKMILIFLALILTVVSLMTYRYEKQKTKQQIRKQ